MICPRRGLYAITQTEHKTLAAVLADVAAVIAGGAVLVQYRNKHPHDALAWAAAVAELCNSQNVPLIINDDIGLAAKVGAAGVHLGKDDGGVLQARDSLGAAAIIGVSCYNSIERARQAVRHGADYAAFGRFFPSASKPLAAPAELATLQQAQQELPVPIVAIGGILPENGASLLAAGADLLAVIGGLYGHAGPEQAARAYRALFPPPIGQAV